MTALEVARQLMDHDALGAHARDELGISDQTTARPVQAALTSAGTFAVVAVVPLLVVVMVAPALSPSFRARRCSGWPCWAH